MLKYKCGDKVKVNSELNIRWDNEEQEKELIGETGKIIESLENAVYPYQIKFDDERIQSINEEMGSRLFDEYEV